MQITGSKNVIDNISLVKASVNLENANETIEKEVKVTVYDKDGNALPVDVEPSVIKVTVPVASPSKSFLSKSKGRKSSGRGERCEH